MPVGATVEWYTPPALFESLGLTFDLDPASPGKDVVPWVPADRHYTREEDGLVQPWRGFVWLNPPYGPAGVPFISKMIEHNDGVMLLPARTETRVFQEAVSAAYATCFLRDRLHFIRSDGFQGRSSFGSVLFAFGDWLYEPIEYADLGVMVLAA